jgi:hypothetical protein
MSNTTVNVRSRRNIPFNFEDGLKVKGKDIEQMIRESTCRDDMLLGATDLYSQTFRGNDVTRRFKLDYRPPLVRLVEAYVGGLYVHKQDFVILEIGADTFIEFESAPVSPLTGEDNIEVLFHKVGLQDVGEIDSSSARYTANAGHAVPSNVSGKLDEYLTAKDVGLQVDVVTNLYSILGNENQKFVALGYSTPGDGGDGIYFWDIHNTEQDDGVNVIRPTNYVAPGRWVSMQRDAFHVDNITVTAGQTEITLTHAPTYGTTPVVTLNKLLPMIHGIDFEIDNKKLVFIHPLEAGDILNVCIQIKDIKNNKASDNVYKRFTVTNVLATYALDKTPINPKNLDIVLNDLIHLSLGVDWSIIANVISISYPLEINDVIEVISRKTDNQFSVLSQRAVLGY